MAHSAVRMRIGVALVAAAAFLTSAVVAQAGTLTGPSCNYGPSSHPFAKWGDPASYTLVPGGSFEGGAQGWTLAGGARLAYGNESFYVNSTTDARSVYVPSGGSALTAPFCVSLVRPTIRLFVSNSGSTSSRLKVRVVYRGLLGILGILDGGTLSGGHAWDASPVMLATLNAPLGTQSAQFVFTPMDSSGSWRIDDLYVDPWVNV